VPPALPAPGGRRAVPARVVAVRGRLRTPVCSEPGWVGSHELRGARRGARGGGAARRGACARRRRRCDAAPRCEAAARDAAGGGRTASPRGSAFEALAVPRRDACVRAGAWREHVRMDHVRAGACCPGSATFGGLARTCSHRTRWRQACVRERAFCEAWRGGADMEQVRDRAWVGERSHGPPTPLNDAVRLRLRLRLRRRPKRRPRSSVALLALHVRHSAARAQ
jgi:hypothetical protein